MRSELGKQNIQTKKVYYLEQLMWPMRSRLQEYFSPYTCTHLRLVTSHLLSSGHHVFARFFCRREDANFLSAT